jgi:hypothetical protein
MPDRELALEILRQIKEAAEKIIKRFQVIHQISDFTDSPGGIEKNGCHLHDAYRYWRSVKKLDAITSGALVKFYSG